MGTLAKEGADFLIVEATNYLDGTGIYILHAGGNQCLNSGKRAELVVNATREDEFFIQAAQLRRLSIEEFELPIDDTAICLMLATTFV